MHYLPTQKIKFSIPIMCRSVCAQTKCGESFARRTHNTGLLFHFNFQRFVNSVIISEQNNTDIKCSRKIKMM